jgi:hypothetical protein
MSIFYSADRANEQAANQPPERPASLDQYAVADNTQMQRPMTQVGDRAQTQFPLVGKDGQQEAQGPILHVNNFDANGQPAGTSEYKYSDNQPTGVKLNGYVDRDAQGNIKEFAVRKPALFADQKDVFMVFRATPGHPIDEASMQHVQDLLRPDVPQAQRLANQQELNKERPLSDNLQHNIGNQIMAIRLDPQTGQRFVVRDMRVDPNTGQTIANGQNPVLCWKAPDGSTYRYPVAKLPDADKSDIANATWHGNLRTPLTFMQGAQQRPMRRVQAQPPLNQDYQVQPSGPTKM